MSDSLLPHGLYSPWNSLGQNTGAGSLYLLQGIFPTQGSNSGLLHCRRTPYQLSHQGSPSILEWEPIPSPEELPDPGVKPWSLALQVDYLPAELLGKTCYTLSNFQIYKELFLIIVTMLYITPPELFCLKTGSLYLWPLASIIILLVMR